MSDHLQITHEERVIRNVEACDGGEEPDVSVREVCAKEVRSGRAGDYSFDAIESFEERAHCGLVDGLGGCKSGTVDAVVYTVVDPGVQLIDVGTESFGEESAARFCGFAQSFGK